MEVEGTALSAEPIPTLDELLERHRQGEDVLGILIEHPHLLIENDNRPSGHRIQDPRIV